MKYYVSQWHTLYQHIRELNANEHKLNNANVEYVMV